MKLFIFGIELLVFFAMLCDQRSRRRLPTLQGRLFTLCTLSQLYVILINNVSMFLNRRYQRYPSALLDGFNALFYLGYIFRAYIFFLYTLELLQLEKVRKKRFAVLGAAVLLVEVVLIISDIFSDRFFFVNETGYHTGRQLVYLYMGALFYILIGYVLLLMHRVSYSMLQGIFFFLYLTTQLLGSVARFFEARGEGLSFAGICAIALIYIAFENPDIYMTGEGRFYNEEALYRVTNEWMEAGGFHIFSFSISRYMENMEIHGLHQMREAVWAIGDFLKKELPEFYVFNTEGRFALLSRKGINDELIFRKISERFQEPWHTHATSLFLSPVFASFDSLLGKNTGAESVQILHFILKKREKSAEESSQISITEKELDKLRREAYIMRVMNRACEKNLVRMFLQPIVDANTGEVCGAEALMRLCDTEENYISPVEFIPLAEKNGQIQELGSAIYTEVCRFYKKHEGQGALKWVNVNLSPIQCLVPSLPEDFLEIARDIGVDTGNVHLEITEEAFIDIPKLRPVMEKLRKSGYAFALDDYGSGYSNLSRIKELPFTIVKLDKSIVWNHFRECDELLPLTIRSLKSLHYMITAEGVETKEMADALAAMGVDYLQGFYFGKPLPEQEFTEKYL